MASRPAYDGRSVITREVVLSAASFALVGLVGVSVAGQIDCLFLAILSSAIIATAFIRLLFPRRSFFSHTFTSLVAVYASIFALFMEELFGQVGRALAGVGFSLHILSF